VLGGIPDPGQNRVLFLPFDACQTGDSIPFCHQGQGFDSLVVGRAAAKEDDPFRLGDGIATGLASEALGKLGPFASSLWALSLAMRITHHSATHKRENTISGRIGTVPTLTKVPKEFFDLLLEMFFPVGFVVHHKDWNVLALHILDESVLAVVKVELFHRFPANQVIVSTFSDGRFMPGDISRPADIEIDFHIDRDTIIKDALVEILYCFNVIATCELEKDHVIGFVDFEHVRIDFLQNIVKEVIVGEEVTPVIGTLGIDPLFPLFLKGIVRQEFCPDFREIVSAFKRFCLTAFEDSLFEFTIEC
jgi:hypothetical protein